MQSFFQEMIYNWGHWPTQGIYGFSCRPIQGVYGFSCPVKYKMRKIFRLKTIGGPGELNSSQASKEIRAKLLEVRPVALSQMNNNNNNNMNKMASLNLLFNG